MMNNPYTSIKVLKDGVSIGLKSISDTDGNSFDFKSPLVTDKPASQEMKFALAALAKEVINRVFDMDWLLETVKIQSMVPEIRDRYYSRITVQGVTFDDRDGQLGIKIHFRIDNQTFFKSPINSHLPFIYEPANEWDELEEEERKGFLSPETVEELKALVSATREYLKIRPQDYKDLPIFAYSNALPEADDSEDEKEAIEQ